MKNTDTNKTPRGIALQLLLRVEEKNAFADRILSSQQVTQLERRDRLFVRELLLGVLRHKLRIDRIIEIYYHRSPGSLEPEIRDILRLGLYQMMHMDSVPVWAAVNESADMATAHRGKSAAGLVNAVLRRFSRDGEPPLPDTTAERISIETSHPDWMVRRWIDRYSEPTAASICRAGIKKHPVFIRIQPERVTAEDLVSRLAEEGFEASHVPTMGGFLEVQHASGLFDGSAFTDGLFTVQDPSAGVAVELLAPKPEESVIDLCAAPGGKSTYCAELMGDCGRVYALDRHPGRLGLVRESADRLGLKTVECIQGDASTFGSDGKVTYDRVLLDAPCTGTGVLSKRPDMKWSLREEDISRLADIQRKLISNAVNLVKPGGVLVYSTCSLEPEENEGNVRWLLESYRQFSLERDAGFNDYEEEYGYLILPHRMGGTGAFAAKLRRE